MEIQVQDRTMGLYRQVNWFIPIVGLHTSFALWALESAVGRRFVKVRALGSVHPPGTLGSDFSRSGRRRARSP